MRKQMLSVIWTIIIGSSVLVFATPNMAAEKDEEYLELMEIFVDTFEQIDRSYVKEVNRRELIEAAIKGMISKLDQYSSYISPEDLKNFNRTIEQEFGGIGIQISGPPREKRLNVISPLPGTPAYKAGVRAGDIIFKIEGKPTDDYTVNDAVKLLTGKPGEPVTMTVKHNDSDELQKIEIVRAVIKVATVLGDKYNEENGWDYLIDAKNKIGYIRLTHFGRRSAAELRHALDELKGLGMRGLILDMRFNPGGLLSQATEISDMFIEEGRIVSTKGRNTFERVWDAKKPGTYSGFPMVVLVNRFSASASEIVSACLKDHKRAVIIGERTWGKGSVQNVISLEKGDSALKLTTASYHRPNGKNIHRFKSSKETDEWGVMPDENYEMKLTFQQWGEYQKYRSQRDVLAKNGPPKSDYKDPHLNRSLEVLIAKLNGKSDADKPKKTDDSKSKSVKAAKPKKPASKKDNTSSRRDQPRRLTKLAV